MKRLTFVAMAALTAGLLCSELSAQTTSTGAFGSRTTGGAGGTTSQRSSSSSAGSGSNIGQGTGQSMLQQVTGDVDASARYVRNNRQGQFVGAGTEDARQVGVVQSGSTGPTGGRGQQMASLISGRNGNVLGQLMSGQFNQGGNQRTRSSSSQLRIPIRMDFAPVAIAPSRLTGQFQQRLGKLPGLKTVGPIEVVTEGETVVLRGVVASEGDRQLAEDLAKLEPEVNRVRNELTIQSQAESSGAALPAPTSANP